MTDPGQLISDKERRWLADQTLAVIGVLAGEETRRVPAGARLTAGGELRIRLVTDAEMCTAHLRHLSDPSTTDVLTFDLSEPEPCGGPGCAGGDTGASVLDADLLACVDEARRRAAEAGHEPARELLLYAVHGLLHCLGHDDGDDASSTLMHAEEDRLLTAIGVGPTYAPGAGR